MSNEISPVPPVPNIRGTVNQWREELGFPPIAEGDVAITARSTRHRCRSGHEFSHGFYFDGTGPYCTECLRAHFAWCLAVDAGHRETLSDLEARLCDLIAQAKQVRDEIADVLVRMDALQDGVNINE